MRVRRTLLRSTACVITFGVMGTAILFACSSTPTASVETPNDSSADTTMDRRRTIPEEDDAASVDAATVCAPHALVTTPRWHPPKPINPSACTPKQAADFVQACLFGSQAVCDGFRQQNAACVACAYSAPADPSWGPLVSYRASGYAEVNHGGCIAVSVGETDETKCGGAFQLFDQCALEACSSCLPITTTNPISKLQTCESDPQVQQICATSIAQGKVECPSVITAAPALRCALGTNTFQENVTRYVSFWCSTPVDLDAGDGGDAADAADD